MKMLKLSLDDGKPKVGAIGVQLECAFAYWKNIDADVGRRIEDKVRTGSAPEPAAGMGES